MQASRQESIYGLTSDAIKSLHLLRWLKSILNSQKQVKSNRERKHLIINQKIWLCVCECSF